MTLSLECSDVEIKSHSHFSSGTGEHRIHLHDMVYENCGDYGLAETMREFQSALDDDSIILDPIWRAEFANWLSMRVEEQDSTFSAWSVPRLWLQHHPDSPPSPEYELFHGQPIRFFGFEIAPGDLAGACEYVLINTVLEGEDDPRLAFIEWLRSRLVATEAS